MALQSAGIALTLGGYFLGHSHTGRVFPATAHGTMANVIFVPLALQLALGIYLKLHINEETIRPWAVRLHGVVGKSYPIFGWVQMLFGAIAVGGYCRGDNLGQCLAHYIMVRYHHFQYGDVTGLRRAGYREAASSLTEQLWRSGSWWEKPGFGVPKRAQSGGTRGSLCFGCASSFLRWGQHPHCFDVGYRYVHTPIVAMMGLELSLVVNTFTEHHGGGWSHKDMQHTYVVRTTIYHCSHPRT